MSSPETVTRVFQDPRLAALGLPHGLTLRASGNMKTPEARRLALEQAGLADRAVCIARQVHECTVLEATPEIAISARVEASAAVIAAEAARKENSLRADGWIVSDPRVVACIYAADCLPIFISDQHGRTAGVFHAGWRGLAAGMPKAAVRAFEKRGCLPKHLLASVGPHIGACCYEVGLDVAERFHPGAVKRADRPSLDLGEEARLQLMESGLDARSIAVSDACTRCRGEEYFSFRREKMDQRMMAFIALRGKA